jgi:hypothetical protein
VSGIAYSEGKIMECGDFNARVGLVATELITPSCIHFYYQFIFVSSNRVRLKYFFWSKERRGFKIR